MEKQFDYLLIYYKHSEQDRLEVEATRLKLEALGLGVAVYADEEPGAVQYLKIVEFIDDQLRNDGLL